MRGFAKVYTVSFYDATSDTPRVQVFTQEYLAWEYFLKLRKELLATRSYVNVSTQGSCFEGYLSNDMGRDYIEYMTWDLNQLPH